MTGYPDGKKSQIPWINHKSRRFCENLAGKNSEIKKNPESEKFRILKKSRIPGDFQKTRSNPEKTCLKFLMVLKFPVPNPGIGIRDSEKSDLEANSVVKV